MTALVHYTSRAVSLALGLVGELVAPSRCAACDLHVSRGILFCRSCVASVERVSVRDGPNLAAFEYGGAIAKAISRLKYEDRAELGPSLGRMMLEVAERARGAVDLVVPVPLHPRRLADRGYNQAALLARPVARALGLPFAPAALGRLRDTPRQTSLDRDARVVNVKRAFATREPTRVSGRRVLLIDDVRTTGATLAGCVSALHEVGVRSVIALVLARRA